MNAEIKGRTRRKIKPGVRLFLATLPILILFFLLCYLPLEGWKYSFYDYKPGLKFEDCEFVGLKHFKSMFINPVMRRETFRVLKNTLAMSAIGYITAFLPMFFAIFLNEVRFKRFKKLVQTVTTVPNFVSWIIIFSVATNIFAVDSGILNSVLKELGIIDKGINILATDDHVWLFMWALGTWKGIGYSAIIYLSAISAIDQELYESSEIDGAGRFQKIRHITIPSLMPTFITLLILSIASILSSDFDKLFVFENAFNKEYIETLDLYVYNLGIGQRNISYSTAVGMGKSLIGLLLLLTSNWISGKVRGEKIF